MQHLTETVTPEGLRARAAMVRHTLNDSGSCSRHLELAADEIEQLRAALRAFVPTDHPDIIDTNPEHFKRARAVLGKPSS